MHPVSLSILPLQVIHGDSAEDVLRYMQYDPKAMEARIMHRAEKAWRKKQITLTENRTFLEHYKESLNKYTYYWDPEDMFCWHSPTIHIPLAINPLL